MDPERDSRLNVVFCHSFFSLGAGTSSPRRLVETAKKFGYTHIALIDEACMGGAVELMEACQEHGLRPILGQTLQVQVELLGQTLTGAVVVLCQDRAGYAQLNDLITLQNEQGHVQPVQLQPFEVLTGGRRGLLGGLLLQGDFHRARLWLQHLKGLVDGHLFLQLWHDLCHGDDRMAQRMVQLAREEGLPCVAAPEIRYASEDQWPLYDALVCARLGTQIDQPHELRPVNGAQCIQPWEHFLQRLPYPEAIWTANRLAQMCSFDLLPDRLTPADASLPPNFSPHLYLMMRAYQGLEERYPPQLLTQADQRLTYELGIVRQHGLENFFLLATEVSDYCRENGILAAGRGSAAGSVLCFVLGITQVDPIKHGLLFERFLHGEKKAMPDVDIDISSSRRREVLAWVEKRFGEVGKEAMVCNRITYRLPSAVQDLARALGLPQQQAADLTKRLGRDFRHLRPGDAQKAAMIFDEVLGNAPAKTVLLDILSRMERGFVRHLAPHSGGVVLSREPLSHYSPLRTSSGGIRTLEFDKNDIETLGLIKLDLLGLRMFSAIENALAEIERVEGKRLDPARLPDHPKVWWRISRGDNIGAFQIESPGQMQLSARNQPRNLTELAHQVALFRPGPIQSNTVHPYLRRKAGKEKVPHLHPSITPILQGTYGTVLYQEQVLRICVHFAGLGWLQADRYRKKLSAWEDETELASLKVQFVEQAVTTHAGSDHPVSPDLAEQVFSMIAAFRGYGFAESHAVAFAQHAYVSAYLKEFFSAAYFVGILNHEPGMYSRQTITQECLKRGVEVLSLDINQSQVLFQVEVKKGLWGKPVQGIRFGLSGVKGLQEDSPARIVLERTRGLFASLQDFYTRVSLQSSEYEALVLGGAFDLLLSRRDALYQLKTLQGATRGGGGALFLPEVATPALVPLTERESHLLDMQFKRASESGRHIMDLYRTELQSLEVLPLRVLNDGDRVRTAGWVISKQRPPSARGVAFFALEDGPVRAQVIISPELWEKERVLLRDVQLLIVEGRVQASGVNVALVAESLWCLVRRPQLVSQKS
ncbi:DNA polymerase III subunit alpha [Deinococcus roseus]|uniref:DNA-directed DNA polymerase n=1 Tax=Deinococcus roseus TaxID=392414 RepID=A0ABQ2DAL8_9DEIO|nr:DNA polymerase III subunit alpha [Deinococcus roseus]GGJ47845.1 error-prone DNA polymerase [Deinococcus roseus]